MASGDNKNQLLDEILITSGCETHLLNFMAL